MAGSSPNSSDKSSGGPVKQMALAFELPFMLVGPVVLGGAIGYFLDRWLHTKPLLLIVLGILGVIVGVLDAIKIAGAQDKKFVNSTGIGDSESHIESRIERFIVLLGALMVPVSALKWGIRGAAGLALGTALCWLNFRWLRHGATAVINLGLAQAGAEAVHVPRSTHAKFFGRLLLLLVAAYVILARLRLPAVSVVCGLAAVVPAILLELAYELISGHHRWNEP